MEKKIIVIIIGSSIVLITLAITLFFYYKNPNTSPDNATTTTTPATLGKTMATNFYDMNKLEKLLQDINKSLCGSTESDINKINIRKLFLISYLNNDLDKMDALAVLSVSSIMSGYNKTAGIPLTEKVIEYNPTTNKVKVLRDLLINNVTYFNANEEIDFDRSKSIQDLHKQFLQTINSKGDIKSYIRTLSFLDGGYVLMMYNKIVMISIDNLSYDMYDDISNMCGPTTLCTTDCDGKRMRDSTTGNVISDQSIYAKVCTNGKCNTNNVCRANGPNSFWIQAKGDYAQNPLPSWKGGQTAVKNLNSSIWFSTLDSCLSNRKKLFGYYNDPFIIGYGYIGNSDDNGPRCRQDVNSGKFWLQLGGDFQNAYLKSNGNESYSPWLGYGYSFNGDTTQVYNTEAECRADMANKLHIL